MAEFFYGASFMFAIWMVMVGLTMRRDRLRHPKLPWADYPYGGYE